MIHSCSSQLSRKPSITSNSLWNYKQGQLHHLWLSISLQFLFLKKDHKNHSCYNINYFVDLQLFVEKDSCINGSLTFAYSVPDAMLVFTGELSNQVGFGYDFLYLGLEGGRLVVKFNNEGGFDFLTEMRTSDVLVNDMELHRVQILFRSGNVDMLVDNSNRVTLTGEREEERLQNVTEYGHLPFSLPPFSISHDHDPPPRGVAWWSALLLRPSPTSLSRLLHFPRLPSRLHPLHHRG